MAYSELLRKAVQVTERGLLFTSDDLLNWRPRETGTNLALRSVVFLPNGRAVFVGESGAAYYSNDLNAEQVIQPGILLDGPTENWLEGVTVSSNLVVAVGDAGAIYLSDDGIRWKKQTTAFTTWLSGIAFGHAGFVAVGEQGTILQSAQGTNWVARTVGQNDWLGITYGRNRYLAVGRKGAIGSSTNGINWTLESSGRTNDLWTAAINDSSQLVGGSFDLLVKEGNGAWVDQFTLGPYAAPVGTYYASLGRTNYFLVAGRSGLLAEGDQFVNGSSYRWFDNSPSPRPWLWDITRLNDLYVAVGQFSTLFTSERGSDWTLELPPASVTNTTLLGVGGDTNLLLAVGTKGAIIRSPNLLTNFQTIVTVGTNQHVSNYVSSMFGVVWFEAENRPTTNQLQGIGAGHDLYVVVGDRGEIVTSANGSVWTRRSSANTNLLSSVTATSSGFVACGQKGTLLVTGPNAISWRKLTSPTSSWLFKVRSHEGALFAVGENGTLLTSPDETTWVARSTGTTEFLTDVCWVGDQCFIIGQSGTLRWSTTYTNWTEINPFTYRDLYGVATDGTQLILVGEEGTILRNRIAPDLTPLEIVSYSRLMSTNQSRIESLFLLGGKPDQRFVLESTVSPTEGSWNPGPFLEMGKSSEVLTYLISQPTNNLPPRTYYRARLLP